MRSVAIPIYDGVQPLDVVGPREVFCSANEWMDHAGHQAERYRVVVASSGGETVCSESNMVMTPDVALDALAASAGVAGVAGVDRADADDAMVRAVDTVLVPGGVATRVPGMANDVVEWLRRVEPRRLTSVCTGTFLLAAAGRCAGRRVTTHWAWADELQARHPDVEVDLDAIWVRDGELWTSAGVTAGIDLALAMVEEDCGADVAQNVARFLVVPVRRSGGQTQFSAPVWSDPPESSPVRAACDLIHASPACDLSIDTLARQVGLSARHFTRRFRSEVGESPARYVERVRVDAARHLLETETVGLEQVARRCGFSGAETLRRAFHRRLGVSPASYRRQFARSSTTSTPSDPTPIQKAVTA